MQNGATGSWLQSSERCAKESRAEKKSRERGTKKRRSFTRAQCREKCRRLGSIRFHNRLQSRRFRHLLQSGGTSCSTWRRWTALRNDESVIRWGLARLAALSKIKRRTDRAESRPGHFVFLRSAHEKIEETFRDISRSSGRNGETRSRSGTNSH